MLSLYMLEIIEHNTENIGIIIKMVKSIKLRYAYLKENYKLDIVN